jgi:thiol-disulfide isomerase/thioredoxin
MRLMCYAAVALTLGLVVAFADDGKPEDAKARAAKLDALKKKFDEEFADLEKRAQKAETPVEARGVQSEMRELVALTAEKALKIAEGDPKDETGLAALEFVMKSAEKARAGGKEVESAVALIAEHHANSPKVKDLLLPAMRIGDAGDKLLKAVSEKGTDKDAKGIALFLRGYKIAQTLEDEDDEKRLNAMLAEATDLIEKAVKEAPNAKLGRATIDEIAKKQLEELKGVTAVAVGKPAPDVESYTLDGKKVKLSDYKGKVVLLDMWATWCPPCRAMIPHERDMVAKMDKDKKPFVLVSVSADDKKEELEKFLEKEPMPWVHWWDSGADNPVVKKFRVRAFPTLYLIDHTGVIRHKWVGKPDNDKLDKAVEDAVKEAIKAKG